MAFMKTCPTCGLSNLPTSPFCARCRVSLVAVAPSENIETADAPIGEQVFTQKIVCLDCKAEIETGAERCIYCDSDLSICKENLDLCVVELAWPWGKEILTGAMRIGRDPPAPAGFIKAINAHGFDNISRSHAEFTLKSLEGIVSVADLGSTNGTFVDGVRVPANKTVSLKNGAVVKFAANLSVTVLIRTE